MGIEAVIPVAAKVGTFVAEKATSEGAKKLFAKAGVGAALGLISRFVSGKDEKANLTGESANPESITPKENVGDAKISRPISG